MSSNSILAFAGMLFSTALALAIILRPKRAAAAWFFLVGMLGFALEIALDIASVEVAAPENALRWQTAAFIVRSFLPAVWLCFSLTYSRGNYGEFLTRWRFVIAAAFILPAIVAAGFYDELLWLNQQSDSREGWLLSLGLGGFVLNIIFLITAILVLMNLEKTFRTAVGTMRWRLKFVVLGLCVILGAKIFVSSLALLYSGLSLSLSVVTATALLIGCGLIAVSYLRTSRVEVDVYPSHGFLYGSITVLLAGVYLLIVGVLARVAKLIGGDLVMPLIALLGIVGLALLLLSDRVRQTTQRLISRHFKRPLYDYRKVWSQFTEKTASAANPDTLCAATATLISGTFNVLSVTLWLAQENDSGQATSDQAQTSTGDRGKGLVSLVFAASTSLRGDREERPDEGEPRTTTGGPITFRVSPTTLAALGEHPFPFDMDKPTVEWAAQLREFNPIAFPNQGGHRICVPVVAANQVLGLIVIGDRVSGLAFSLEELALLRCIGNHVAASLLSLQLMQKVAQATEQEAFRTVSTFFAHDLKNAASTLSLMLQNLPRHFGDPAFREDVLRGIAKTVNHLNHLISRLSVFHHKPEIRSRPANLNEVVGIALSRWEAIPGVELAPDLQPLPDVPLDREQIQNVLTNLLLNARDASAGRNGQIRVRTAQQNGWAVLTVSDDGSGMTPEFLRDSLFRPFQTTKKGGTGIGMFQCKLIVEAHRGKIDVESESGKGTSFRVFLPMF